MNIKERTVSFCSSHKHSTASRNSRVKSYAGALTQIPQMSLCWAEPLQNLVSSHRLMFCPSWNEKLPQTWVIKPRTKCRKCTNTSRAVSFAMALTLWETSSDTSWIPLISLIRLREPATALPGTAALHQQSSSTSKFANKSSYTSPASKVENF